MLNGKLGGVSLETREPISTIIKGRLPVTMLLACYSLVLAVVAALPLGALAAAHQDQWPDRIIRAMSLAGLSLPVAWTAIIVIAVLLLVFRWSPPIIYSAPQDGFLNHFQIMVWPVLLLAWQYGSHVFRITRSQMIEILAKDHITAARARGLKERSLLIKYALKSSLVPIVTLLGIQAGTLLSGILVIETVFGLPGIGRSLIAAAISRDYQVVQSIVTLLVLFYLLINLAVDVVYSLVDPRIKTAE